MQKGKVVVWGGFTNSWGKKRSKRQGREGKIYPTECWVAENSKETWEGLLQRTMQRKTGNHRMGKTRDLFKKIRDLKGTFHARMSMIKDRNDKDLTEADEIKMRWQGYTEDLYKKGLNDWNNHSRRARHPGVWSQVDLRKHHYEQS